METLPENGEGGSPGKDGFNRPLVTSSIKQAINDSFKDLDGKAAIIIISDQNGTRAHLAAKLDHGWKVAAGGGFEYGQKKPYGFVAVEKVWK